MKNFFLKTLSTVLSSLFLSVVMFFSFISIHSGRFPPTISQAREYINSLAKAKETYTAMVSKSENYIKHELADSGSTSAESTSADSADLEALTAEIKSIKVQLGRIEQQNKQILQSLPKQH